MFIPCSRLERFSSGPKGSKLSIKTYVCLIFLCFLLFFFKYPLKIFLKNLIGNRLYTPVLEDAFSVRIQNIVCFGGKNNLNHTIEEIPPTYKSHWQINGHELELNHFVEAGPICSCPSLLFPTLTTAVLPPHLRPSFPTHKLWSPLPLSCSCLLGEGGPSMKGDTICTISSPLVSCGRKKHPFVWVRSIVF